MVLVSYFPTQYTKWKGTKFTIYDETDIERIRKWIKSLIRGQRKQAIQIICDKEYEYHFPDFTNILENNHLVLLFKYY